MTPTGTDLGHNVVMITGSRDWDNRLKMEGVLQELWLHSMFNVIPFPPDERLPSPARFHKRNNEMLDVPPGLVLAFPKLGAGNKGTDGVVKKAKGKGIRVMEFLSA